MFAPLLLLLTPGFHRFNVNPDVLWWTCSLSCRRPNISNIFLVIHDQETTPIPIPQHGNKPSPSIGVGIFQAVLEICVYTDMEFYLLIKLLNPHPSLCTLNKRLYAIKWHSWGTNLILFSIFVNAWVARRRSCEYHQWCRRMKPYFSFILVIFCWMTRESCIFYHLFVIHCWQINKQ